jgi:hypothetical protein
MQSAILQCHALITSNEGVTMKRSPTTKEITMNRFRSCILLSVALAVAAMSGCSKETPTPTNAVQAQSDTVRSATRYVDPKVGVKTTPFSINAPAEHPAGARTTAPAH